MTLFDQGERRHGIASFLQFGGSVVTAPRRFVGARRGSGRSGRWFLAVCGIFAIVSSFFILGAPFNRQWAASISLGATLLLCGGFGLFSITRLEDGWPFVGVFGVSAVMVIVGVTLMAQSVLDDPSFEATTAACLSVLAALRAWIGIRNIDTGGWIFTGLGVVTISFAVVLWTDLPTQTLWTPQLLVGMDLAIWGATLLVLSIRYEPPSSSLP